MAAEIAPESTLPYPPIHTDKKFVVLSDWLVCIFRRSFILVVRDELTLYFLFQCDRDGTITTYDSNDCTSPNPSS
jgi:hypothetical protein